MFGESNLDGEVIYQMNGTGVCYLGFWSGLDFHAMLTKSAQLSSSPALIFTAIS